MKNIDTYQSYWINLIWFIYIKQKAYLKEYIIWAIDLNRYIIWLKNNNNQFYHLWHNIANIDDLKSYSYANNFTIDYVFSKSCKFFCMFPLVCQEYMISFLKWWFFSEHHYLLATEDFGHFFGYFLAITKRFESIALLKTATADCGLTSDWVNHMIKSKNSQTWKLF